MAPLGPDLLNFAGLQESKQEPLHTECQLADFVEEDRTVLAISSLPGLSCAPTKPLEAEQLGFQQGFRNARAVHRNKWGVARLMR